MRKLEEHFCTYEQREALIELGLNEEEHELSCEYYNLHVTPFAGFLRSQALDFFRDKSISYQWLIDRDYSKYFRPNNEFETFAEAESALIDKLIEIEMEAQNGK